MCYMIPFSTHLRFDGMDTNSNRSYVCNVFLSLSAAGRWQVGFNKNGLMQQEPVKNFECLGCNDFQWDFCWLLKEERKNILGLRTIR